MTGTVSTWPGVCVRRKDVARWKDAAPEGVAPLRPPWTTIAGATDYCPLADATYASNWFDQEGDVKSCKMSQIKILEGWGKTCG